MGSDPADGAEIPAFECQTADRGEGIGATLGFGAFVTGLEVASHLGFEGGLDDQAAERVEGGAQVVGPTERFGQVRAARVEHVVVVGGAAVVIDRFDDALHDDHELFRGAQLRGFDQFGFDVRDLLGPFAVVGVGDGAGVAGGCLRIPTRWRSAAAR